MSSEQNHDDRAIAEPSEEEGGPPTSGSVTRGAASTPSASAFHRVLDARLILSVVAAGIMSFSGVVVETAMNVTFPTLMTEFDVETSTVQWLTTSYLLVLAAIVPTSSYLNKRFRTRHVFVAAMAFYIAGIVCGLAATVFPMLLVGRVLEGVGTGIALPLMFNIITEQAPERHIGIMMGIGTLVNAMAPAVGPSLGGWLAETFGWRMIFAALLPVLAVAFVLGVGSIRQSHPVSRTPFDAPGWAVLACSFAALILGVNELGTAGVGVASLGLLAAFVALLACFVARERSCDHPLIALEVFRVPAFDLGLASIACVQFSVLGLSFLLPNYAQLVMGAGETEAGSILLLGCAVGAVMAPLSGQLLDRLGPRRPVLTGTCCMLVALVLLCALSERLETVPAMLVYTLFAFGQSLMIGNAMTTSLLQLRPAVKADGNAVINTLQQLFGAMGTSAVTAVVNAAQAGAADMTVSTMLGTREAYAALTVLSVVPVACWCVAFFRLGVGARR